ncbi:SGNH/GDSL hydrolase family protein [Nakamurella sp.]|uniref:SGNH/GDSL hydrolase family protein n=1 Tax=Nakamurella sp. TaxID=1869182 RepID=UPI003B3ACDC3
MTVPASPIGQVVPLADGTRVRIAGQLELLDVDGAWRPVRLPSRRWTHFPPAAEFLRAVVEQPAGVRLLVRTAATRLALRVRCTQFRLADQPLPANCFVACVDGTPVATAPTPLDGVRTIGLDSESATTERVRPDSVVDLGPLPPGDKTVQIWLPQSVTVDLLGLSGDAPVDAAPTDRPVWLHHGSSISHCVEAGEPTSAWPVVAAREANLEVINLGFAGQCMLDPFVADAIAATPADVISLKVGINLVGARAMDRRTFVPALHGFLDRIRAGHPRTPLVLASAILWPGSEDVPGPGTPDIAADGSFTYRAAGDPADVALGALTLATSREHVRHVAQVRAAAGEPIHYLDGRELYGAADAERSPLPDGLHPDGAIYREMGARFARLVFGPDGLLPRDRMDRAG